MNPERPTTLQAVAAALQGHATIAQVAKTYGIATSTLRRALRRRGAPPRAKGTYNADTLADAARKDRLAVHQQKLDESEGA